MAPFFLIIGFIIAIIIVPVGATLVGQNSGTNDPLDDENNGENETKMEKSDNKVVLSSGDFQIEVNARGQVPFYHFNTTVDNVRFFLKFQQLVQFKDENDNNKYDPGEEIGEKLQLPSVKWEVVIITDTDTEEEFVFHSIEINNQEYKDASIELINHFTGESPSVKFDINISNWAFVEEATGLALEFELNWSRGGNEGDGMSLKKESDDTSIYLRNDDDIILAYFESASDVEVDGDLVTDGAKLHDTASANASKVNIFLSYPRFSDTLFHDPTFGATSSAIAEMPTNPSAIAPWLIENVIVGFLAVTVITTLLLGSLVILNRRYQK